MLIFDSFDSLGNNHISANDIDLDNVPAEIILVFKPLLLEMEKYDEELDKEEFIESSLALLQQGTVDQKNLILNFGKKLK